MSIEINIPKVSNKITFKLNSAIRDAVEYLEGNFPGDVTIATFGNLRVYEDGNKIFVWKGRDCIHFHPIVIDEENNLIFTYDKLYMEENNERSDEFTRN